MKKLLFFTYLIILCSSFTQLACAQSIKTVAGNGTAGFSGDGGVAQSAKLNLPFGAAFDGTGNLYIADSNNHVIRRVDATTGIITTIAGTTVRGFSGDGAAATAARLAGPMAIAIDNTGDIYICDQENNRIRKITVSTGIINTIAGNGSGTFAGDGGAATAASLFRPFGLAFDGAGDLYIADRNNSRIRKITFSTNIISTVAGNGTIGSGGDGSSAVSANLNSPVAVTFSPGGDLYIVDNGNAKVRMVNTSGIINTVAGNGFVGYTGDGGQATAATFSDPQGIAFDGLGNYFVADRGNNVVRMVNTSSVISTVVGTDTASFNGDCLSPDRAHLNQPSGLAFDNAGNLTIADKNNHRVRKIIQPCSGAPVAGVTAATRVTGCPNYADTLSLLGAGLSCDYAYQWQSSSDSITYTDQPGATGATFFLAPSRSVYYRAKVTCINSGVSTYSTPIYLNVDPLPNIAPIVGPSYVCVGSTITLTDTAAGGTWRATNANATVAGGVVTGVAAGLDSIVYFTSNFCGTLYDTAFVMVYPVVTPTVTINTNTGIAVCDRTSVTYTAVPTDGGTSPGFRWTVNGAYYGAGSIFTYTPANGDVIEVTMNSTAPCTTVSSVTNRVTMIVTNLLVPSVAISNGLLGDSVCAGDTITFYSVPVNGGSTPTFSWAVNGTVLGTSATYSYVPSNGDVLTLVMRSGFYCASPASVSDTARLTVTSTQTPDVLISANPGDTSCSGYSVTYTAFWRYGGLNPILLWKKNGVAVATGPNYITIPSSGDYVQCVLYSSSSCRTADSVFSNIITMTVGPRVTSYVTISAVPGTIIAPGQSDTLIANVVNGGADPTYQWYLNGAAIAGATNSSYISNAFVDSDSVYCSVLGSNVCASPSVMTSNQLHLTVTTTAAVAGNERPTSIMLTPNPNEGSFNLNGYLAASGIVRIQVLNMLGSVVYATDATINNSQLSIKVKLADELAAGTYMIHVQTGNESKTIRFNLVK